MFRKFMFITFALMLVAWAVPGSADAGQPDFSPALWGDGELWATTAVTGLNAPNDNNVQSFDKLFVIVNSNNPDGQLPVSEAAPGNPDFNGGRWYTHTVEWTASGFADHGTVPVLTSYAEIMVHYNLGHLTIEAGSPPDGPPAFFLCPLFPVK